MDSVYLDRVTSDDERRAQLFHGQLFVYSATPGSKAFVQLARDMIKRAFGSLEPETAQFRMPVEEYVAVLSTLKPDFIHDPRSKECIQAILRDLKCDPEKTYFDLPRLRTATSDDYLTTGMAYAFHPHRDTWYSAPQCQVNFWMPVYPIVAENAIAFHPRYWSEGVRNGSAAYNYSEWKRTSRWTAARHIKSDTRKQPKPEEPMQLEPQLRLLPPPGGMIVFSGAQMHSTVPNTSGRTRFSIDFRIVHIDDVRGRVGAPNVDSACTGTTMGDYLRGTDLAHLPEDLIAAYDTPAPTVAA